MAWHDTDQCFGAGLWCVTAMTIHARCTSGTCRPTLPLSWAALQKPTGPHQRQAGRACMPTSPLTVCCSANALLVYVACLCLCSSSIHLLHACHSARIRLRAVNNLQAILIWVSHFTSLNADNSTTCCRLYIMYRQDWSGLHMIYVHLSLQRHISGSRCSAC